MQPQYHRRLRSNPQSTMEEATGTGHLSTSTSEHFLLNSSTNRKRRTILFKNMMFRRNRVILTLITMNNTRSTIRFTPRQSRLSSVLHRSPSSIKLSTMTRTSNRRQSSSLLNRRKRILTRPLRSKTTRSKDNPSTTNSNPRVRLIRIKGTLRPRSSLLIKRSLTMRHFIFNTSRNTLRRIRSNKFRLFIRSLLTTTRILSHTSSNNDILNNNGITSLRQRQPMKDTRDIRINRFNPIPNNKRRTIITITIMTPIKKRRTNSRITTKGSIRSITLAPNSTRQTINLIIIIRVRLRIQLINNDRNHENNGNMSRTINLFRLQRYIRHLNNGRIHSSNPTTMTTSPRLRLAKIPLLPSLHRVNLRKNGRNNRQHHRTMVNTNKTNISITNPLTTVTTTPRRRNRRNTYFTIISMTLPYR